MSDPSPSRDADMGVEPDHGPSTVYPGAPHWVKFVGIVALVLLLLAGIMLLTGVGGDHGPGRHVPSSGMGGHTPPMASGAPRL